MNKFQVRYIFFFLAAFVLQITLVKYIQIFNWRPDIILIVLVAYSLRFGPNWGMTAGFVTGLLQDVVSVHLLGLAALSNTVAGFVAGSLSGKFNERSQFILVLLVSGFIHDLIYFFFYTVGENFSLESFIFLYTIPNLAYTVIVGVFLHFLLEAWLND